MTKKRRLSTTPTTQPQLTRMSVFPRRTTGAAQTAVSRASRIMPSAAAMTLMDNARTSNNNNNINDPIRHFHNSNTTGDNKLSVCCGDEQRRSENANSKSQGCVNCASVMLSISNENIGRRQVSYLQATANKIPCGKYPRSAMLLSEGSVLQLATTGQQQVQWRYAGGSKICGYNNNMKNTLVTHSGLQQKNNSVLQNGEQAGEQLQAEHDMQQQQSKWRNTPLACAAAPDKTKLKATLTADEASPYQIAMQAATTATTATKINAICKPVSTKLTSSTKANLSTADNSKRTRKLLKSAFERPSAIRVNASGTLAPANSLTPTKGCPILTNTYAPAALPTTNTTTTRATATLWATLRQQALVTVEEFACCRSSKRATNNGMNNNNCSSSSSSSSIANGFVWLLSVLCLLAAFGCGQAGFACLSNPCIFGVCIDGLNR